MLKLVLKASHYVAKVDNPLDPITFVHKIKAAVFMACQWEDEQTGGHCADLAQDFTGTSHKWFTFTNGAHIDSLDPATFDRWYDFLSLFVAHRAPNGNLGMVEIAAPFFYSQGFGISGMNLPFDSIQHIPTYQAALSAYEALPSVRVLFDNGAGFPPTGLPIKGEPYPAFEASFPSFPIPGTVAQTWYFGSGGSLATGPAQTPEVDDFTWNPKALPATDYASASTSSGGLWGDAGDWDWSWQQNPGGTALSYLGQPLAQNTTVIGGGAVHVWVKASTPSVDLQATVSEVRRSNQFSICRAATSSRCRAARFVEVTVPLYYEGHVYRAGSRIRVTIAAPGGTQPLWAFAKPNPSRPMFRCSSRLRCTRISCCRWFLR